MSVSVSVMCECVCVSVGESRTEQVCEMSVVWLCFVLVFTNFYIGDSAKNNLKSKMSTQVNKHSIVVRYYKKCHKFFDDFVVCLLIDFNVKIAICCFVYIIVLPFILGISHLYCIAKFFYPFLDFHKRCVFINNSFSSHI